jgi:hypothetical protein
LTLRPSWAGCDNLVVHVGEVHHLRDGKPEELQRTPEQVFPDVSPEVPDVSVVVDGGSTGIHANFIALQGAELFDFSGQRVVEAQGHEKASR